jgi:hypothetical protein
MPQLELIMAEAPTVKIKAAKERRNKDRKKERKSKDHSKGQRAMNPRRQ